MHGIDFGVKNLYQTTKKWLPEVVTAFQALFSVVNHKANTLAKLRGFSLSSLNCYTLQL